MRVIEAVLMFRQVGPGGGGTAAGAAGSAQRTRRALGDTVEAVLHAAAAQPRRAEPDGKRV